MSPSPIAASTSRVAAPNAVTDEHTPSAETNARWAVWQALGRTRDRVMRRRLFIVAPAVIVPLMLAYLFFVR